jgi:hypothetical protein
MKKLKLGLILGLMVIMMFLITMIPTQAAITSYNVALSGVEINYSGSYGNEAFFQRTNYGYDDGYIYFGFPTYQSLELVSANDANLIDGIWTISSTNINYRYMYIGYYELDIYTYKYQFAVDRDGTGNIDIVFVYGTGGTTDQRFDNDIYITASQASLFTWMLKDDSQDSVTQAFQSGYEEGQSDYGYLVNGVWVTANDWGNDRYQDGLAQGPQDALAIRNMIPGILGVMIAFFFQIASISVLGISILDILALTLGITVTIFLLRVFLNR